MKNKHKVAHCEVKTKRIKKNWKARVKDLEIETSVLRNAISNDERLRLFDTSPELKTFNVLVNSLDFHRTIELLNWTAIDLRLLYEQEQTQDERDNYLTKILSLTTSISFISEMIKIHSDLKSRD